MIALIAHTALLVQWLPPIGWVLLGWLVVAAAVGCVASLPLRRNATHYPAADLEEARDGR